MQAEKEFVYREVYFDSKEELWDYLLALQKTKGLTKQEILDLLENMTWRTNTWIGDKNA